MSMPRRRQDASRLLCRDRTAPDVPSMEVMIGVAVLATPMIVTSAEHRDGRD
jgi:hypothetical protein